MTRLIAAIAILAVAALFAWAVWPRPIPADFATIGTGPLTVTVEDEGVTRIEDLYTVSAPTGGTVQRSPRRVGDVVQAGQTVLASIRPAAPAFLDARALRAAQAAVAAARSGVGLAEAQVAQARAELDFAQSDLARAMELARRETISTRELDRIRLQVASAQSALASAEAAQDVRQRELESAQANLIQPGLDEGAGTGCCIDVRAPVSGRVLRIMVESEQVVQAGTPLVEVGDPGRLEVAVDLLSRDAVRVDAGASAIVDGWGGPALEGRVVRVEPTAFTRVSALGIEEQRVRTVIALLDPEAYRDRLGHNFRIVARIAVWQEDEVVQVPLGALFREAGDWAVFVVDADERARLRRVVLGERTMQAAQVLDGLEPGERVVLHPSDRIADGVAVEPRG